MATKKKSDKGTAILLLVAVWGAVYTIARLGQKS